MAESLIFIVLLGGNCYVKRFIIVCAAFLKEYVLLEVSGGLRYYYFYKEYILFFVFFFLRLNPNNFVIFIRFPDKANYIGLRSSVKSNLRDFFNQYGNGNNSDFYSFTEIFNYLYIIFKILITGFFVKSNYNITSLLYSNSGFYNFLKVNKNFNNTLFILFVRLFHFGGQEINLFNSKLAFEFSRDEIKGGSRGLSGNSGDQGYYFSDDVGLFRGRRNALFEFYKNFLFKIVKVLPNNNLTLSLSYLRYRGPTFPRENFYEFEKQFPSLIAVVFHDGGVVRSVVRYYDILLYYIIIFLKFLQNQGDYCGFGGVTA